jgi:hypothetical protein
LYEIFILKDIMKNIINEELGRMKNLFGYKRGMVISEQAATLPPSNTANFPTTIPAAPTDPWVNFPCVTGNKNAVKGKLTNGSIAYTMNKVTYYSNGRKRLSDGTMANFTCNDVEFKTAQNKKTTVKTPFELKDAKGIMVFQDWLDGKYPGWATGYQGGIINKGQNGSGYGKFGPRTQKAWKLYATEYKQSLNNVQTIASRPLPNANVPALKEPTTPTPNTVGPTAVGNDEFLNSTNSRG